MPSSFVLGIDASNLRGGGGRTHLIELLRHADIPASGFSRVVVWGSRETLGLLDDAEWLVKQSPPELERDLFSRSIWQRFCLSSCARKSGCHILLVPGGTFTGDFSPVVTMCQNMLPFEAVELFRYRISFTTLRLLFLRLLQASSFRQSQGVIFLSRYAEGCLRSQFPSLHSQSKVIPNGISDRFRASPRMHAPIESHTHAKPFRILYVSTIEPYKHQWNVVEAVHSLRTAYGWPLTLDIVGPAYPPSMRRLASAMARFDPQGLWVSYHGPVKYEQLHLFYQSASVGVFASSCENMPHILLETMSAGLPVACSSLGPMPEVLGSGGVYFNPLKPDQIASALLGLIGSPSLRSKLSVQSFADSQHYSWPRCASETFGYLVDVLTNVGRIPVSSSK